MKTKLPAIIAGTMNWGSWGRKLASGEISDLISTCVDSGLTAFDHADIYGGYTTEAEFGKALTQSGTARDSIQLISKCGIMHTDGDRNVRVKHYNYSKDYIIWSVENSLKNLQTDYLDVFLLHRPSPLMIADEIAEAVMQLQRDGKIRDFGLSNFTAAQAELIRQQIKVSCNQVQFSATHLEPMLDGSFDYMQIHKIRPMAWNPLGIVFRENTDQARRLKTLLSGLTEKYDADPDLILTAWILKHPAKVIPVVGTANPERIRNLMNATEIELDIEDWFAIWSESIGTKVP